MLKVLNISTALSTDITVHIWQMLLDYRFTVQWFEDAHSKAMCFLWEFEPVTLTLLASCSSSQALTETSNRGLAVHFPIEWLDVCLPSCLFVCGGVEKKLFVPPRKILTALLAFFPNQSSCHFDLSEVYISPRASESKKLLGEIFMSRTEGYKLLPGWWTYGSISRLDFSSRSRLLARQRE